MTTDERLKYRQGLFAIATAIFPGLPAAVLEKKIMTIQDDKLLSISNRFAAVAKEIVDELNLGGP